MVSLLMSSHYFLFRYVKHQCICFSSHSQKTSQVFDASKMLETNPNISRSKKREGVRDVSTMTNPFRGKIVTQPTIAQARTFIANAPQTIQVTAASTFSLFLSIKLYLTERLSKINLFYFKKFFFTISK